MKVQSRLTRRGTEVLESKDTHRELRSKAERHLIRQREGCHCQQDTW